MRARQTIKQLPIQQLTRNPANIREELGEVSELAVSIKEHGILEPLIVTENPDGRGYLILAGHRRLAAACLAGLTKVPVVIRHGLGDDDIEQLVVMLVENCQRRDLNPVNRAEAYGALINRGVTRTEIARRVGVTPGTISYYLSLLHLDEKSREQVRQGTVNSTDAIAAVRQQRQLDRKTKGSPKRGRPAASEPHHFGSRHPLAYLVRRSCTHTARPRVGQIGCGQCWEAAIRADAAGTIDELAARRRSR